MNNPTSLRDEHAAQLRQALAHVPADALSAHDTKILTWLAGMDDDVVGGVCSLLGLSADHAAADEPAQDAPAPRCPSWCDCDHGAPLGPAQVWQPHERTTYSHRDEPGGPLVTVSAEWTQRVDGAPDTDTPHVSVCLDTDDETSVSELSAGQADHMAQVLRAAGGPDGLADGLALAAELIEPERTVVVGVGENMPPRVHMVLVEDPETGVVSATFRPELGADERRAAARAVTDPGVRARLVAALASL